MNNYSIYKFTFPDEKIYVGKTNQLPVEKRWGTNGNGYKTQPVYKAIQKFGWENIKKEIIFSNLNKEEAEKIESNLICSAMNEHKTYNYNNGIIRPPDYKEKWVRENPEEIAANEKLRKALSKVAEGYRLTDDLLKIFNTHPNNITKWVNNVSGYGISLEDENELRKKIIAIKEYWNSIII